LQRQELAPGSFEATIGGGVDDLLSLELGDLVDQRIGTLGARRIIVAVHQSL
jgi:hypothetical protein